jgi:hypothetical protein
MSRMDNELYDRTMIKLLSMRLSVLESSPTDMQRFNGVGR